MFELVLVVLLWTTIALFTWWVLGQLIPKIYLTRLGIGLVLTLMVLRFFFPWDVGVANWWQILSLPLKPLGLIFVLILPAATGFKFAKDKDAKLVILKLNVGAVDLLRVALVILLVTANPWISQQLERNLIRSNLSVQPTCQVLGNVPPVDAIVLETETLTRSGQPYRPDRQIERSRDRILAAVREYNRQVSLGNSPLVVVFDRAESVDPRTTEARLLRDELVRGGIPADNIIPRYKVGTVRQSAEDLQRIIPATGDRRVLVVGDDIDSPRAKLAFEKLGFNSIPSSPNLNAKLCQNPTQEPIEITDIVPSAEAMQRTTKVIDEFFTITYYLMRDWV
ncbi:YdcF family protein [[Phormidium] sp. ETS-05]|uniref:YdcF family protein n=1 Tax=[Phormidium] sp. ETS-05 TaxID=222819 RepID=UPI0018EEE98A|nr:YdcF family protein [[Phormidium] sp. ETS-05]